MIYFNKELAHLNKKTTGNKKLKKPTRMTDFTMKDGSCPWTYLKEMCEGGACPWEVFYMIQGDYNSTKLALEMVKEENKGLQQKLEEEKSGREHDVQQFQSVLEEKGQLEAKVEELQEENKKLQFDYDTRGDIVEGLKETIKKLKQKATAWDIITSGDWEYVRDLCDKEMCKDLIACGECKEEDFEGYEGYEEEDDIEDNDPEEYGEYTWKEGLTAEEIAKGDTIDPVTGEPIKK